MPNLEALRAETANAYPALSRLEVSDFELNGLSLACSMLEALGFRSFGVVGLEDRGFSVGFGD